MWLARDKNNALYLYNTKPLQNETCFWVSAKDFPFFAIKNETEFTKSVTWENSPIKVDFTKIS